MSRSCAADAKSRYWLFEVGNCDTSVLSPALSTYEHRIVSFRDDLIGWLKIARANRLIRFDDVEVCARLLMDVVFGALLPRGGPSNAVQRSVSVTRIKTRLVIVLRGLEGA